ncbi:hypothetical protein [Devosia sp. LjRoot3]|uniref:hypothetical protein n=1 Tax=Devosia sp. LjRoot3 TaxID=3342319 RepID=UPI003ECFE07F
MPKILQVNGANASRNRAVTIGHWRIITDQVFSVPMRPFARSIVAVIALVAFLATNIGIAMASVGPVTGPEAAACIAIADMHTEHPSGSRLHDGGCATSPEKGPFDHHDAGAGSPCCALNCHAALSVAFPDALVAVVIGKAAFSGLKPERHQSLGVALERPPRTIHG